MISVRSPSFLVSCAFMLSAGGCDGGPRIDSGRDGRDDHASRDAAIPPEDGSADWDAGGPGEGPGPDGPGMSVDAGGEPEPWPSACRADQFVDPESGRCETLESYLARLDGSWQLIDPAQFDGGAVESLSILTLDGGIGTYSVRQQFGDVSCTVSSAAQLTGVPWVEGSPWGEVLFGQAEEVSGDSDSACALALSVHLATQRLFGALVGVRIEGERLQLLRYLLPATELTRVP